MHNSISTYRKYPVTWNLNDTPTCWEAQISKKKNHSNLHTVSQLLVKIVNQSINQSITQLIDQPIKLELSRCIIIYAGLSATKFSSTPEHFILSWQENKSN